MLNMTALVSNLRARRNTTELTIEPLERYPSKKKWQPYFSVSKKSPQCVEEIISDISKHALQGNTAKVHALWSEWQDELKPEHILKILLNLQINSTSPLETHYQALSPALFLNIVTCKSTTSPLSLTEIPQTTKEAQATNNLNPSHSSSNWIYCTVLQEILNQTKIQEHSPHFKLCITLIESIPLNSLLNYKSILKTLIEHQHLSILKHLFNHYGIYPLHQQALKIAKSLCEINPHTHHYTQTLQDIHEKICDEMNSKVHAPFLALGGIKEEDLKKIDELIEFKISMQYIIMLSKCCNSALREQYTFALIGTSDAQQDNQMNADHLKDDDFEDQDRKETKDFLDDVKAFKSIYSKRILR